MGLKDTHPFLTWVRASLCAACFTSLALQPDAEMIFETDFKTERLCVCGGRGCCGIMLFWVAAVAVIGV